MKASIFIDLELKATQRLSVSQLGRGTQSNPGSALRTCMWAPKGLACHLQFHASHNYTVDREIAFPKLRAEDEVGQGPGLPDRVSLTGQNGRLG